MDEGWIQTALTGAGVTLSGAVAALFKYVVNQTRANTKLLEANTVRLEKKLDDCEVKHETTQSELKELTFKVGELQGYQKGIENLAKQVLEVVGER